MAKKKSKKKAKKSKQTILQKPPEPQAPQVPGRPQKPRFSLQAIVGPLTAPGIKPIILCLLFFINGLYVALQNSGTCDELGAHIPSGCLYWETGEFGGGIDNPPLGQLIVASLVKLFGLEYTLFSEQHLFLFRLPVLFIGLLLAIFIYKFTRLYDKNTAIMALFFYCFSPNILAHTSLATLDVLIACFIFLAVYFAFSTIKNQKLSSFIGLCVSLSFALATKIQALLLLPLLLIIFAAYYRHLKQNKTMNTRKAAISLLLLIIIPFIVINLVYLNFPLVKGNGILPGDFVSSIKGKFLHSEAGHFTYLLGDYSETGWWYYFPLVILFKTPLAVLILLFIGISRKPSKNTLFFIILPLLLFLAAAMRSHVNIGIRHILIIYPFLFILAALGALRIVTSTSNKKTAYAAVLMLLVVSYLFQAFMITPHQLSYFNILAGGSKNGHKILIDSNYDWGQNDYFLSRYIRDKKIKYKINPNAFTPTAGHILVNANALYGVLNGGPDAYVWLKQYQPVNQIAYTWFEYYVPEADLEKLEKFKMKRKTAEAYPDLSIADIEALQQRYAADTNAKPHLQLAVMFIDKGDYKNAFKEIRYVLNHHPTSKFALSLGGELIVRFKLGVLDFKDDDYIKFFRSNK